MNDSITAFEIDQTELTQLAKNLNYLIKQKQLSEADLGRVLNLPLMTIRRLTSGETKDPRVSTLKLIADYFNITLDSLLEKQNGISINYMTKNKPLFLPILDWATASKVTSIKELDLVAWKEWHPVTFNSSLVASENTFILKSTSSMYPRYPYGTMLIIDPEIPPTDGDIVLIKKNQNSDISLKELLIDLPERKLLSLSSSSDSIILDEKEYHIVGTVILTLLYKK